MAKQVGAITITGCIQNVCFYKLYDEYYARSKSSLDGKRVKRDIAFAETMKHARLLGEASKIASHIYNTLPKNEREHRQYLELTGKAMQLLKNGFNYGEAIDLLS